VFMVIVLLITMLLKTPTVQASPQMQATSTPAPQPTPTFDLQRLEKPVVASVNTEQLKKGPSSIGASAWLVMATVDKV
jgi:hypothetical protein